MHPTLQFLPGLFCVLSLRKTVHTYKCNWTSVPHLNFVCMICNIGMFPTFQKIIMYHWICTSVSSIWTFWYMVCSLMSNGVTTAWIHLSVKECWQNGKTWVLEPYITITSMLMPVDLDFWSSTTWHKGKEWNFINPVLKKSEVHVYQKST